MQYRIMDKSIKSRTGSIHLYDRNKEGLGSYDIHYINAYKKNKKLKQQMQLQRYAA
tara:strand:- start:367 stop:534 length:168 start_codon:yes stop_codon:yes gene_type:complete